MRKYENKKLATHGRVPTKNRQRNHGVRKIARPAKIARSKVKDRTRTRTPPFLRCKSRTTEKSTSVTANSETNIG